jgi:hypothetical protein
MKHRFHPLSMCKARKIGRFFDILITLSYIVCVSRIQQEVRTTNRVEGETKMGETYRTWMDFEQIERRKVGTFQLCIDDLAKDLYIDYPAEKEDEEEQELNFDFF